MSRSKRKALYSPKSLTSVSSSSDPDTRSLQVNIPSPSSSYKLYDVEHLLDAIGACFPSRSTPQPLSIKESARKASIPNSTLQRLLKSVPEAFKSFNTRQRKDWLRQYLGLQPPSGVLSPAIRSKHHALTAAQESLLVSWVTSCAIEKRPVGCTVISRKAAELVLAGGCCS